MNSMLRECKSEIISVKTIKDVRTYHKTKYVPAPKYNIKLCFQKHIGDIQNVHYN